MHILYKGTKGYPQERKRLFAYFYIIKICYRLILSICKSNKKNTLRKIEKVLFGGKNCVFIGTNYLHKIQYTVYPTYQFPLYGGKGGSGKERCFLNLGFFVGVIGSVCGKYRLQVLTDVEELFCSSSFAAEGGKDVLG